MFQIRSFGPGLRHTPWSSLLIACRCQPRSSSRTGWICPERARRRRRRRTTRPPASLPSTRSRGALPGCHEHERRKATHAPPSQLAPPRTRAEPAHEDGANEHLRSRSVSASSGRNSRAQTLATMDTAHTVEAIVQIKRRHVLVHDMDCARVLQSARDGSDEEGGPVCEERGSSEPAAAERR